MAAKASTRKQVEAPVSAPGLKPKYRPGGVPTKRTPETRAALLHAIEIGLSDRASCDYACVSPDFFYSWIKADSDFSDEITRARGRFVEALQEQIRTAAAADWRAASWLLSRRKPEDYAERQILSVEGEGDSPLDRFMRGKDDSANS